MGKATIAARAQLLADADAVRIRLENEQLLLIDTRDQEAFGRGHLPGAVNLPPSSMEWSIRLPGGNEIHHLLAPAERLGPLFSSLGVNGRNGVVVYDEGEGYNASRVFWILDYFGHPDLMLLDGGLAVWRSLGGALTTGETVPPRGEFTPRPDPGKIADFSAVQGALGSGRIALVNTLPSGSFRKEAIPGSVNIPYLATYRNRNSGPLLARHLLAELFRAVGISSEQEVIPYCGIGYTASQLYVAARVLGFPRVRLYDGSLADWRARGGPLVPGRITGTSFNRGAG
jgi:thiosulfate/3-mercaptopyruvate sulfurtransferase